MSTIYCTEDWLQNGVVQEPGSALRGLHAAECLQGEITKLDEENSDWLYEADGKTPTKEGLAIQRYIQQSIDIGINGVELRWNYATAMVERDLLRDGYNKAKQKIKRIEAEIKRIEAERQKKLPSFEWKQPREAGEEIKHPVLWWILFGLLQLQIFCRLYFHSQDPEGFFLPGLIVECLLDPLLWLWGVWFFGFVAYKRVKVPGVGVGEFDCPHCGESLIASEQHQKAPIGYVSHCASCKNEFIKQSAPPQL